MSNNTTWTYITKFNVFCTYLYALTFITFKVHKYFNTETTSPVTTIKLLPSNYRNSYFYNLVFKIFLVYYFKTTDE